MGVLIFEGSKAKVAKREVVWKLDAQRVVRREKENLFSEDAHFLFFPSAVSLCTYVWDDLEFFDRVGL